MSGTLSFIIVAAVVALIGWSFASRRVNAPGPLQADKTVIIPAGSDVADTLEDQGVIESAQLMTATLLLEGSRANVKAGEYLFKQNASLQDVIDTLVSGKQVLHSLTIPEGLTSSQVIDRLRENDVLVGDVKTVPPEGSLMPDTFKFSRGTTRDQLIKTMQQEAKRVVSDVWAHREADTPIRSPYEMVTLASIVEKETGKADERPRVAGVFINRLSKNIPLQSDPTIVYGLVGGKGTLGRGILKSEVEQKTPYNTYTIAGLPPGPIANPGKAALEAVANPSRTKELYFVADGTGGHAFAETLDQHRANVLRWRQIEKDAKDKLTPDADRPAAPVPAATPSGKVNQRGDAQPMRPNFGTLGHFGAEAYAAADADGSTARIAAFPLNLQATGFSDPKPEEARTRGRPTSGYGNGQFDELDVEVDGVRSKDLAAVDNGGAALQPDAEEQTGSLATFPVSAGRRAEMKARAAEYGLPGGPDSQPGGAETQAAIEQASQTGPRKIRIFDASEGTALDPLRDKTYDLNSPKSVPVLKALPPMAVSSFH